MSRLCLYLWPGSAAGEQPAGFLALRAHCLSRSALVRWESLAFSALTPEKARTADLIAIEWDAGSGASEAAYQQIRDWERTLAVAPRHLLLVRTPSDRPRVEKNFQATHRGAAILDPASVGEDQRVLQALQEAKFEVPVRRILSLTRGVIEPGVRKVIRDVGEEQFDLILQKYFPGEDAPELFSVEGGWSGDPLIRVKARVDGQPAQEFFLKFFSRSDKFNKEIEKHSAAFQWLQSKGAEIPVHWVPGFDHTATDQMAAFPATRVPPFFPVCYLSASAAVEHVTFKDLFWKPRRQAHIGVAFKRILQILNPGNGLQFSEPIAPFAATPAEGLVAFGDPQRTSILRAIGDLDRYGPAACGDEWRSCRERLELLVYRPLSGELMHRRSAALGPIHGDPNPRNALVNPDQPDHILMIDCGDFEPTGRLVFDLALIERDIKLVLMGNEERLGGFYDLNVAEVPKWLDAEKVSVEKKLAYSTADVDLFRGKCPSASAAHDLVVAIRKQAKAISGRDDAEGRQYFAALLYWMVRGLDERAIPPTKKLLALYSMAQILRVLF